MCSLNDNNLIKPYGRRNREIDMMMRNKEHFSVGCYLIRSYLKLVRHKKWWVSLSFVHLSFS